MADNERLTGALQENILTILCFNKDYARLVRAAVTPQLFESSVFREVAGHAIDFLDQYGEPIGEHLPDHLEDILKGDDKRKAESYNRLVQNLFLARDSVNGEYVKTQLQQFVRAQNMKSAIVNAVEAIERGDVDECALQMQKGLSSQIVTFESGINISDATQALTFLDHDEAPLLSGIDYLDQFGVGPAPGTLFMVLAPTNKGKSWWLMHLGKWALLQGRSVLHITLEMSEHKVVARYLQSFFSITKRAGMARVPSFVRNRGGDVMDIIHEELLRPSMEDPDIRSKLASKIRREFRRRPQLKVKGFPTGQLTIPALEAYLENLARFEKLVPDVIIVDYADLMALDAKNLRTSMGENTKALRGIAVARNACMVTASQTNREGMGAKVVDATHTSEDISKTFTADTIVTYNQTDMEEALQIARLYVPKNRDDQARMMTLITQAYAVGQFCLDSAPMGANYWNMVKGETEEPQEERPARRQRR